ncbi:ATP-binding protein [Microbacterium sp. APC 3901]|uniref:ATP-binding protein n=1 Tax=Microbacterium sp. APC 3901 TaxID=3035192 RepID=UPI0025B401C6|nr:ATP-binding protein [Microbacterium sp. APC 3901]MDN3444151.1 hypothetical protein [Microbacterium sp. APC 3901]
MRKHSGAASAEVTLAISDAAELRVRDDGRGLGGVSIDDDRGFGLAGMRERVALVGGSLTVADGDGDGAGAGAGAGTDLTVRIPLRADANVEAERETTP